MRSVFTLLVTAVLLPVPVAQAQITRNITDGTTPPGIAPGAPAGSYPLSDFDNVNLFNGNLNFRLPLLEVAGRGDARYTITLPIEHHWTIDRTTFWSGNTIYYPHTGWWSAASVGYGPGVLEGRNAIQEEFCSNDSTIVTYTLLRLTFIASDGTEYELRDKLSDGTPDPITEWNCQGGLPPQGFIRGREFVSRDGTTVTFTSDSDLQDRLDGLDVFPTGYLMFRNGTRYRIEGGLVKKVIDRNGNQLTFDYDTTYRRITRITDSLRRTVDISYPAPGAAPPFADTLTFKGFGGANRQIRINRNYMQTALRASCPLRTMRDLFQELVTPDTSYHNPVVVTSVQLPDNRQYQFFYNSYGDLARVVLPTGGALEYDIETSTSFESGSYGSTMVYRRVKQRRIYDDGTPQSLQSTTYLDAPLAGGPDPQVVTVRQQNAAGALTGSDRHSFYGRPTDAVDTNPMSYARWREGREHQTEQLDFNGVAMLRRVNYTWAQRRPSDNSSFFPPDVAIINDPRIIETVTTLETGQSSKQSYAYSLDAYNNKTDTYEYDYGATSWTRRTHIDYVTSAAYTGAGVHLRGMPLQESVYDASGVERARTTYEYDNYVDDGTLHKPLVARAAISQLDAAFANINYTARGNVTRTGRWLNTNNSTIHSYQQYDVAGNIVKAIDARGYATNFGYNDVFGAPNGEARANTAPADLGGQTTFAFLTQVANPLGHVLYTQYDFYLGKAVDVEDPNGAVTSAAFADPLDRITQVVRAYNTGSRNQTTFSYNDASRVITTGNDLTTYGDNQLKTELVYDGLGRTVETRQYEGATAYIATKQSYDAESRVWQVSNPYRPASEALFWTTTTYDALGRVKRVTTPDGAMVDTVYQGNETVVVDQAAKQRKSATDALGRLVKVTEDPTGLAFQTTYTYDPLDKLRTVQQGGQTRAFVYDSLGRLTSATNPENGTIGYQYDNNGNLIQKSDARGTISYGYDPLNRIMSRSYTDGTPLVTFAYDAPGVAYSKGRLTSVSSTVSTYGYDEYDALGSVRRSSQVTNGNQYLFSYGYSLSGGMTSQVYPSGRTVSASYDAAARISGVTGQKAGEANKTYATLLSYASHGPVKAMLMGNGLWEHAGFNNRLQPLEIGLGISSTSASVLGLVYSYGGMNNNGNVLSQTITAPGFNKTQSYTYDALNRLQQAAEPGAWSQTYGYDQYANRWVTTGSYMPNPALAPQSQAAFNPANNRLAASQYDSAGNQTRDAAGNTYTYNLENLQTAFNGATAYVYDGEGRRIKKAETGGTTIFVYNAHGRLVAEYSDLPPSGTSGTSYLTADHLGSTRAITDATSAVKKRYDYLPFGEEILATIGGRSSVPGYSAADTTRHRFTAKERDPESGLDYFGARYFSGPQGRFTSVDSGKADASNPQIWNRYAYVYNNPLRLIDADGRQADEAAVRKMLEALRAPMARGSGLVKGGLIQTVTQYGVKTLLGEIFGYPPMAFKGALDLNEYRLLNKVSSYEKGATMLGMGTRNYPGIDAVDVDNVKGISLKEASNIERVKDAAVDALKSADKAGFNDVQVYIDAPSISKNDATGLPKIQNVLGTGTITKLVIFTGQGPVEYRPTEAQQKQIRCREEKDGGSPCQ